jgi:hypothetical protein
MLLLLLLLLIWRLDRKARFLTTSCYLFISLHTQSPTITTSVSMSAQNTSSIIGPLAECTVLERNGVFYLSPTHVSLPAPPASGDQGFTPSDIQYWRFCRPQYYHSAWEHLPFLLTEFDSSDPLLGRLYGKLDRAPLVDVIYVKKSSRMPNPASSVPEKSDGYKTMYFMNSQHRKGWLDLEQLLIQAINTLWAETSAMGVPLGFVGHLRQASTILNRLGQLEDKRSVVHAIGKARDWLLISASLLSYTIARYRLMYSDKPFRWYAVLGKAGLEVGLRNAVRQSVVSQFNDTIRRVGVYVRSSSPHAFLLSAKLFLISKIPIWVEWGVVRHVHLTSKLEDYRSVIQDSIPVPAPWTNMESSMHTSCTPNSILPPKSRRDAALNINIDRRAFITEKATYATRFWNNTIESECRKIEQRLDMACSRSPAVMNAAVYIWETNEKYGFVRVLANPLEMNKIVENAAAQGEVVYNPVLNEFDISPVFRRGYSIFAYVDDDVSSAPQSTTENDSNSTVADHIGMSLETDFGASDPLPDITSTPSFSGLGLEVSVVESTDLGLNHPRSSASLLEIMTGIHGISIDPITDEEVFLVTTSTWIDIKWTWGVWKVDENEEVNEIQSITRLTKMLLNRDNHQALEPFPLARLTSQYFHITIHDPTKTTWDSQCKWEKEMFRRQTIDRPNGPWFVKMRLASENLRNTSHSIISSFPSGCGCSIRSESRKTVLCPSLICIWTQCNAGFTLWTNLKVIASNFHWDGEVLIIHIL